MSKYWINRRVLVTGAQGFVGGNLIKKLVDEGAIVTAICHRFPKDDILNYYGLSGKINVEMGNISDIKFISKVLSDNEIQDVFHLGAVSIVRIAVQNPLDCFETNIKGTWNILEACRQKGNIESIVVSSSDKSYGSSEVLPYKEDMALNGMSVYEASKSCTDILTRMYAKNFNLNSTVFRSANIYGYGDFNFSRIIPNNIMNRIVKKELLLYADVKDYIREYIFVDDVINAMLCLSERILETKGESFNVGSGEYYKAIDLLEMLCVTVDTVLGREGEEIKIDSPVRDKFFKEIEKQYLDCSKIRNLGWEPEYTVKKGMEETVKWYIEYFKEVYGWEIE